MVCTRVRVKWQRGVKLYNAMCLYVWVKKDREGSKSTEERVVILVR